MRSHQIRGSGDENAGNGTSRRVVRALYLDDAPRDFSPEVAFSLSTASLSDTSPLEQALMEPKPIVELHTF